MVLSEMFSERGKKLLIFDNYKFYCEYKSKKSGEKTWRCCDKKCRSKFYTNYSDNLIREEDMIMCHEVNGEVHMPDITLNRQIVNNSYKIKADAIRGNIYMGRSLQSNSTKESGKAKQTLPKDVFPDTSRCKFEHGNYFMLNEDTNERELTPPAVPTPFEKSEVLGQGPSTSSAVVEEAQPSCSGMVTSQDIKIETPDFLQEPPEHTVFEPMGMVTSRDIKIETPDFLQEPLEQIDIKPTYKSSRRSQDRIVCRLCLQVTNPISSTTLTEINPDHPNEGDHFEKKMHDEGQFVMKMLKVCVPLIDCSLTSNPVICSGCLGRLQHAYNFITMCNSSQNTIEEYKNVHAVTEGVVDINDVIESGLVDVTTVLPRQKPGDSQPPAKRRKMYANAQNEPHEIHEPESNIIDPSCNLVDHSDTIKFEPEDDTELISPDGNTTWCANTEESSQPYSNSSRDLNAMGSSNLDLRGQSHDRGVPSRFRKDVNLLLTPPTFQSCIGDVSNLEGDDDNH